MDNKVDSRERTVFIAQLPSEVSEEYLYGIMGRAGLIEKIIFKQDRSGQPQYSLVVFVRRDSVVWCMSNMNSLSHNGRQLLVRPLRESSHVISKYVHQHQQQAPVQQAAMLPMVTPQQQQSMVMSMPPPIGSSTAQAGGINRPMTRLYTRQQQQLQAMQFSGMSSPAQQVVEQPNNSYMTQMHSPMVQWASGSEGGASAGAAAGPGQQGYLLVPMANVHKFTPAMAKHWAKQ